MWKKRSFYNDRLGLAESINAVLMLLIMLTVITIVIVLFTTYSTHTQEQMNIDTQKSKEQIAISNIELDIATTKISSITINNTGEVEVQIRALYVSKNGVATFLDSSAPDPSSHISTYIPIGKSLIIPVISGQLYDPESRIIAATEKGTKTIETEYNLFTNGEDIPDGLDPNNLYAGPLSIDFNAFYNKKTQTWPNPNGAWEFGATIDSGSKCVWKITITNIGDRDITLSKDSSFTTVRDATTALTWFIDAAPIDLPRKTGEITTPVDITFVWDNADKHNKLVSIYQQSGVNAMVFLTFFGYYHDTTSTPYAQTIPFEATRTT